MALVEGQAIETPVVYGGTRTIERVLMAVLCTVAILAWFDIRSKIAAVSRTVDPETGPWRTATDRLTSIQERVLRLEGAIEAWQKSQEQPQGPR